MIPSLLLLGILAAPGGGAESTPAPTPAETSTPTPASTPEPEEGEAAGEATDDDGTEKTPAPVSEQVADTMEGVKAPVDVLAERMIGSASRAVRFDWRAKSFGVGVTGGELLELNNFNSRRIGVSLRRPFGGLMGEADLVWVETRATPGSRKLALTPYRQVGRPSRLELDVNVGYPLAEGVATARPGFFPATELVFSARGGVRYLYYPGALSDVKFRKALGGLFSPTLLKAEREYLEARRPGGMQVDRARYNVLVGLGVDVYFHAGGYLAPRAMVALPLTGSQLGPWWEFVLDVGWMF